MSFATDTTVSVEKSRSEIERILARYGASSFAYMTNETSAVICFVAKGKMVKFLLPLPDRSDKRFWFTPTRRNRRSEQEAYREWVQACRSKWRALCLCVKAKFEAVESGITTFEAEFLAHSVIPGGGSFGEWAIPQLEEGPDWKNAPACALSSVKSPRQIH
jgi:hypothetical protein